MIVTEDSFGCWTRYEIKGEKSMNKKKLIIGGLAIATLTALGVVKRVQIEAKKDNEVIDITEESKIEE